MPQPPTMITSVSDCVLSAQQLAQNNSPVEQSLELRASIRTGPHRLLTSVLTDNLSS